jgi:phosphoribulokinase
VEGLLTLHTPALQRSFDLTVYLDPDERLRHRWKLKRDTTERGYTPTQVRQSLARRLPDSEQFIWPQKQAADLVVHFWPPYGYFDERVDHTRLNVRLFQRHSLPRPNLQELLAHAHNERKPALTLEPNVWSGGQPVDILDIDGALSLEKADELEGVIVRRWPPRHAVSFTDPCNPLCLGDFWEGATLRHSEPLALTQLLIAHYLLTLRQPHL